MAQVELRGIRKTYEGGAETIKGVNLSIRDGEFMVFVGPSGCGKSTMLRMIAGLEDISAGELLIGGELANEQTPTQRGIAMVFQNYALYPHMTVAQNLEFGLKIAKLGTAERAERVKKAAEILQIEHLLERKPKALSGGQRQRVAIGRAIVRKPKVFLFDEPLSNLDAALRGQMRVELSRLHEELGVTMIYVTHDQVEAMTLGQRIAVFNHGVIEQVGSPLELYHQPANRFVAGFLGSPTMNFLPAAAYPRVAELGRGQAVHSIGIRPDDIRLCADGQGLPARVSLVEQLGDQCVVYLALDGQTETLAARINPRTDAVPPKGARVDVVLDHKHLHFFDAQGRVQRMPEALAA